MPKAPPRQKAKSKPAEREDDSLLIVGIGASAGGLEALRSFVGSLPQQARMSYIIAQHLSPQYDSLLTELLSRETELPVEEAREGLEVVANTIYVTPQNTNILFRDGRLKLEPPAAGALPKPSVDVLLGSIAESAGEHSVGVVLSGTGSDGALGMRAIKAAGGCTYVQDEQTAKYSGMPHAAIAAGCADFVMPPERIAEELGKLAEAEQGAARDLPEEDRSTVDEILKILRLRTGTDFGRYKDNTVRRRLQRRIFANRFTTAEQYLEFLKTNPDEVERAAQDILISVTSFFRDPEAFEKLDQTIRKIFGDKQPGDEIRIWVPGCATGEEAYSIALIIYEVLGASVPNYKIQIFATDIDQAALGRARKASFHMSGVTGLPSRILRRYFVLSGDYYVLNKAVRDLVVVARQDLTEDPPFLRLDLISCRNLLIYFRNPLQIKVLEIFHYALRDGGYLFLGKSESAKQGQELFQTVDGSAKIYQRINTVARARPSFSNQLPIVPEVRSRPANERASAAERLKSALVSAYAPAGVLIDSRLHILQVNGNVHPYLMIPEGDLDWQLHRLLRRELRLDVRSLIGRAKRQKASAFTPWVKLNDMEQTVRLAAHPLHAQALEEDLYLIAFEVAEKLVPPSVAMPKGENVDARIAELEDELATTRDHLQTAVEELETSNEELQSVNEELQSANEELQSTNEELETANEELQSTNEELTTVNDELQTKTAELLASHTDLENVNHSLGFALIVVDADLRVRFHNPLANKLFKFSGRDSHPLITSASSKLDLPNLRELIEKVIKTGTSHVQQIEGAETLLFSIVPYRQADKRITGAILTFIDNSAMLRGQRELRESQAALFSIISNSPLLTYYRDTAGKFIFVSRAFESRFGLAPGAAVGQRPKDILPADVARLITRLDAEAMQSEEATHSEDEILIDGSTYTYLTTRFVMKNEAGGVVGVVAKGQDISDRKAYEHQLWLQSKALQESVNGIVIADATKPDLPIRYVNQSFENLTGYSSEEVMGKNCRFLQGQDRDQEGVALLRDAIRMKRTGRALLKNYRKDGSLFWNEISIYPVRDDQNRLLYFVGIQLDMSARIAIEQALNESRERLATAQEFARTGDFEWLIKDNRVETAESLRRLLGLGDGKLRIEDVLARVHEADVDEVAAAIERVRAETLDSVELEFRARGDRRARWFHLRAHRFDKRADSKETIIGLVIDIDERKQAELNLLNTIEQLRRSNQDLEEFVYVASHDLKEPLRKLSTFTDLVQRKLKIEDQVIEDYLNRIRKAAIRMERFIEDLLAYSQLTGNAQFKDVDLDRILSDVLIDLENRIAESQAKIESDPLPVIRGNAMQMGQLFANLISNSLKYAKPGVPPEIKISCERKPARDKTSEMWEIIFQDNGIGFDNAYAEQVFSVFRRLHDQDAYQGTGIGLAICRKVAHRHGGEISASGEPNKGARFTLCLPIPKIERRASQRAGDVHRPALPPEL